MFLHLNCPYKVVRELAIDHNNQPPNKPIQRVVSNS